MSERISPRLVRTAGALIIGGEILSGKIRDENSFALAQTLRSLGIELRSIAVVPDDRERIAVELQRLLREVEVVFTSGGVGPTHDDVTIEAVALAQGLRAVSHPELEEILVRQLGERATEAHHLMTRVPEGASLLGSADFRWPLIVAGSVWIFPGVPELFRSKLVLVREYLRGPQPFFSEFVDLQAEEAEIKTELDQVVEAHPGVEIGSYPKWFDSRYKTRITFDARSAELVHRAVLHLREVLAPYVVATG